MVYSKGRYARTKKVGDLYLMKRLLDLSGSAFSLGEWDNTEYISEVIHIPNIFMF
jgi:hypothetical protein